MKFDIDKKLLKYCVYIIISCIVIYIAFGIMGNIGDIIKTVGNVLSHIATLFKPLIIAFCIAYVLYPLVNFFEDKMGKINFFNKGKRIRGIGVFIAYIIVLAAIGGIIIGIYFMIGGKITGFTDFNTITEKITGYINNIQFSIGDVKQFLMEHNIDSPAIFAEYAEKIVTGIQGWLAVGISTLPGKIAAVTSNIVPTFLAIFISVYLLIDSEYFIDIWKKFYYVIFRKSKLGKSLGKAGDIINKSFSNYIRGQLVDAIIIGILSAIALSIVGVDSAVIIGIIAGICNLIPYIGPVIGTVLAILMALPSGEYKMIIWVIVAMVIVQQIDNNLIAPRIVGDSVGLHPVFTMLAILIGGNVGGLLGMLIAVPLTASFKTIISDWFNNNVNYPTPLRLKEKSEDEEEEVITSEEEEASKEQIKSKKMKLNIKDKKTDK